MWADTLIMHMPHRHAKTLRSLFAEGARLSFAVCVEIDMGVIAPNAVSLFHKVNVADFASSLYSASQTLSVHMCDSE